MGHPKKLKKKYSTPPHPWNKERIIEEAELVKEYGLKKKREIWKMRSYLRKIQTQAKDLIARTDEQSTKEEKLLIKRLVKLNLVQEDASIDNILGLTLKAVMNRRLQTILSTKGIALSTKQARQFITHGHVFVADKKISVPSYLVLREEEDKIKLNEKIKLDVPEKKVEAVKEPEKKNGSD